MQFLVECYILQKKLNDALKLSKETLNNIQENIQENADIKFNF